MINCFNIEKSVIGLGSINCKTSYNYGETAEIEALAYSGNKLESIHIIKKYIGDNGELKIDEYSVDTESTDIEITSNIISVSVSAKFVTYINNYVYDVEYQPGGFHPADYSEYIAEPDMWSEGYATKWTVLDMPDFVQFDINTGYISYFDDPKSDFKIKLTFGSTDMSPTVYTFNVRVTPSDFFIGEYTIPDGTYDDYYDFNLMELLNPGINVPEEYMVILDESTLRYPFTCSFNRLLGYRYVDNVLSGELLCQLEVEITTAILESAVVVRNA